MEQKTGKFLSADEVEVHEPEHAQESRAVHQALPTLAVGEVVPIKGVLFRVTRIKTNGKLGLKMMAGAEAVQREHIELAEPSRIA